jgi:hypothetical protein
MSKARQLADLGNQIDDGAITGSNMVINGAMTVAQRSSSVTGVTSIGYYTCDRWNTPMSGAGTWTITQSTDAPDGFANSLKLACTTANASLSAGSYLYPRYLFEGQDIQQLKKGTSSAESITVSFWVKSNKTGTYHVGYQDQDNNRLRGEAYTINSSSTWEYKVVTVDGDTTGTLDNDNASSLQLHFWLVAGSTYTNGGGSGSWAPTANGNYGDTLDVNLADTVNNYWQITGVCLNVGDSAIDFPHESYGDTLAKCQRYYWQAVKVASGDNNRYPVVNAAVYNTGTATYGTLRFPVAMRAAPTFSTSIISRFRARYGSDAPCVSGAFHGVITSQAAVVQFSSSSSITAGRGGWIEATDSAEASFDAEL